MKPEEKDKLIEDFMASMVDMQKLPGWRQVVAFTSYVAEFIDKIENAAKLEGFNDGFKEGKRQYEKKLGKLN